MKKFLCLILILSTLLITGCSINDYPEAEENITVEEQGDLTITYIYDYGNSYVIAKNVYNNTTGITTEYSYYYKNNGWETNLIGTSIVIISKEGEIISQFTTEN